MTEMLEEVEFREVERDIGRLGVVEDEDEFRRLTPAFLQALLQQLHQHGGEGGEVHQEALCSLQVRKIFLRQLHGREVERIMSVRHLQGMKLE